MWHQTNHEILEAEKDIQIFCNRTTLFLTSTTLSAPNYNEWGAGVVIATFAGVGHFGGQLGFTRHFVKMSGPLQS